LKPAPRQITLKVNGQVRTCTAAPDTPLAYLLRNDLGLTGTKFACGLEQCGACKVLVDGEAVPSCRLPAAEVEGCQITTIEGLADEGELHPVQQAFVDEQAAQCGFCTSGLIVAAAALLEQNPEPTAAQVKEALAVHICRCGSHSRVLRAIRRAADMMATNGDGRP
jgi:nicotinate dehydrogenase subunit A